MVWIALLIWALLAKLAAGVFFGLWMGERGRRKAAERMMISGSPDKPFAFRIADQSDPELRAMTAGREAADRRFSDSTIERGVKQLLDEAEDLGRPIGREEARKQVEAMLYGAMNEEELPEIRS